MIDTLALNGSAAIGAGATGSASRMGRNEFMTLLLTQLRHQDPLNPLQPHEFASQLANFSSVEELASLNQGMNTQLEGLQLATALSKTAFSASLLGRSVLAEGNHVAVGGDAPGTVTVDVGDGGGDATLRIYDSAGREVARREVGPIGGGRQSVELPEDLPEGSYTYRLEVRGESGQEVGVTHYVSGAVERVLFEEGQIILRVAGHDVPLESLVEIGSMAGTFTENNAA